MRTKSESKLYSVLLEIIAGYNCLDAAMIEFIDIDRSNGYTMYIPYIRNPEGVSNLMGYYQNHTCVKVAIVYEGELLEYIINTKL